LAHHFVVVPQWFIDFSAHPQLVKQYCQLPRHRNDGSFLGILSSSLGYQAFEAIDELGVEQAAPKQWVNGKNH
jgi:hypothetical protein